MSFRGPAFGGRWLLGVRGSTLRSVDLYRVTGRACMPPVLPSIGAGLRRCPGLAWLPSWVLRLTIKFYLSYEKDSLFAGVQCLFV